jgi:hypothetical protein
MSPAAAVAAAGASVANSMHNRTEEDVKVSLNWCLAWCLHTLSKVDLRALRFVNPWVQLLNKVLMRKLHTILDLSHSTVSVRYVLFVFCWALLDLLFACSASYQSQHHALFAVMQARGNMYSAAPIATEDTCTTVATASNDPCVPSTSSLEEVSVVGSCYGLEMLERHEALS